MDSRSHETGRRGKWWSRLFGGRKGASEIEQPLAEISHRDSILVEEDLLASLPRQVVMHAFITEQKQRPTQALMDDLLKAFYDLAPHLGSLTTALKDDLILCRDIFLNLRINVEELEDRPDYEVDIDLLEERSRVQRLYHEDQMEYEKALLAHSAEVDRLRAKIYDIDQQMTQINAEQVIDHLRDLGTYQRLRDEIDEQIRRAELAVESASCFSRMFCCTPKAVRLAYAQIEQLERKRMALAQDPLDGLRRKMVDRLKIERDAVRARQDALSDAIPSLNNKHRDMLARLEARIAADQEEYYQAVPESVMLQLLRLYECVRDVVRAIPDVDHVELLKEGGMHFTDDEVQRLKGIRDVFEPLKMMLKDRLPNYYCALPGRFYFTYYVEQYRKLSASEQERFMRSDQDENLVARVFETLEPEQPASTFTERRALLVSTG